MESLFNFGELSQDENFKLKIIGFRKDVESASKMIETFLEKFNYETLSSEDKIRYDLFLAFAINSYFWMYLRIRGVDPNQHEIKEQINRIRNYMNKSKEIYNKKTIMPRINQDAAKRFIKSGLWMPTDSNSSEPADSETEVPSKRKKKNDTKK